jgi:hypothetical protein
MIKSAVISTTHLNVFGILMKTITLIKKVSFFSLLLVVLGTFVTGCSEDKKPNRPSPHHKPKLTHNILSTIRTDRKSATWKNINSSMILQTSA